MMTMMMTVTITGMRMPKAGLSDTLLIGISAPSHALTCDHDHHDFKSWQCIKDLGNYTVREKIVSV